MNTMGVKTVAGSTGSSRPPGGMSVALLLNTDTPNFPHRESNSHYHPNPPLRNPSPRPQTPSEAYATIGLVHEDNIQTSHGVSRWQVEGTLPHQQRGYSHAPSPSPTQERRHSQPLPHTLPPPSLPPPPPPPRSTPPGPQGPTSPPGGRGRSASQDRMDEELRRPIPNTKYAQSKFVNYGPPRKMGVPILPATQKALCRTCGEGFQCDSLRRKHEARHTKPFKCPFKGCHRGETGFTSKNDRGRHVNSVHKGPAGAAVGYNCMYGNCKDKQKIYYRLDNFRNHLKKLHPPRDASAIQLEQFIKRAENDCRYEDPLPMDVNQDTASETASVATSMMPTDALGKATIQSDAESVHTVSTPGRASFPQDGSGFTPKKRKQAELVHPPSYRPWTKTMLNAAEQERSSNSMDIDSDPPSERNWKRHESSTARQLAPPPIPKVDMEKAAKEKERLRKIMVLKDQILKLQGEVQTLEKEGVENASLIGFQPGRDSVGTSIMPHEHGSQENRPPLSQQALVGCPAGNVAIARFVAQDPKDDPTPFVNPGSANGEKSQVSPMEMDQSPTRPEMDRTGFGSRTGVLSPPETVASPAADHRNGSTGFHPMEETIRTPGPASPSTSFVPPIQAQPERGARPGAFANREAKGFPCDHPGCKSKFHRESELRKHKKRHTRPYGCTYRHCGKTFGSKNDWKRHENSQHHKLESWKCQMTLKAGDKCGKLCYRKENFINHLKSSAHNLKDRSLLESETENSYIGGPGHHTFWCGFCIDPSGKRGHNVRLKGGLAGWDERFDHLAQHFETGSNIKSFNHPDDDGGYTDCSTLSEPEDDDLPETLSPLNKLADLAASKLPIARHIQSSPQHMDAPERLQKRIPSASGPSMGLSGDQAAKVWFCCRQHPAGGLPHPQLIDLAPSCFTCEHARCGRCSVVDAAPEK